MAELSHLTQQCKPALSVGQLLILHVNQYLKNIGEGFLNACISSNCIKNKKQSSTFLAKFAEKALQWQQVILSIT